MPFTPYHFGPALLIGVALDKHIDLPTFMAANIIVDIEPLIALILGSGPLHGFFHSFLGGELVAVALAALMILIRPYFNPLMKLVGLQEKSNNQSILYAALTGVGLHIIMDSVLYTDIRPFLPLEINPFYLGYEYTSIMYSLCFNSGMLGLGLLVYRWIKKD
jgi:membrane-bound metal-dependent hydrolase YbcI (DUF457 family)